mmetsp:Transcript_1101/g.3029  ORF Transcript_1101/g.3029 Transcript_1101/m.3029 type:complete len:204 (-) Transcript_1101:112-723(-)
MQVATVRGQLLLFPCGIIPGWRRLLDWLQPAHQPPAAPRQAARESPEAPIEVLPQFEFAIEVLQPVRQHTQAMPKVPHELGEVAKVAARRGQLPLYSSDSLLPAASLVAGRGPPFRPRPLRRPIVADGTAVATSGSAELQGLDPARKLRHVARQTGISPQLRAFEASVQAVTVQKGSSCPATISAEVFRRKVISPRRIQPFPR